MNNNEYMSVKDAANFLNVTEKTVINRINRGELEGLQEGRFWKVRRESVEESAASLSVNIQKGSEGSEVIQILKVQLQEKTNEANELRKQVEKLMEDLRDASQRHDTVVMQFTRIVEYQQQPFWRKLFQRKQLPPAVDEAIIDGETGVQEETNGK